MMLITFGDDLVYIQNDWSTDDSFSLNFSDQYRCCKLNRGYFPVRPHGISHLNGKSLFYAKISEHL